MKILSRYLGYKEKSDKQLVENQGNLHLPSKVKLASHNKMALLLLIYLLCSGPTVWVFDGNSFGGEANYKLGKCV